MKILVNASTLVVGGGIQIGVSFIQRALEEDRFEWSFLVSKGIYQALTPQIRTDKRVICIPVSPAKLRSSSKREISRICNELKPDLIYSIGFPSYLRFEQLEIGRYTNPWEINKKPLPWHLYPKLLDRFKIQLGIWYRQYWSRRANFIETQTEAAKRGINQRLGFPFERIKVIPNSPNSIFIEEGSSFQKCLGDKFQILCLAAPHPHKNLKIIPEIALILKERFKCVPIFSLTIPEGHSLWPSIIKEAQCLGVESQVMNLGKISMDECLKQYKKTDVVFLPTLMEIFSATYLESMAMGVPIVTSDLDFARDNCGDAALYFKPDSTFDASEKIHKILSDKTLRIDLINKGRQKLRSYPTNYEKYKQLFDWFEDVINNKS